MRTRSLARLIQPVGAVALVVVLLGVPFWLVAATAGQDQAEALNPSLSLPSHWQLLANFAQVLDQGRMITAFLGSLLIMVPAVFGALLLDSMASWIRARRRTRAISFVYALAISGIVLPPAVVTIVLLLRQLGLAGTAVGMIGVYMGMYMSTVIFFVTGGRIDTLPLNLFQVASAGLYLQNWHLIFAYIILMSLPLLITFAVMQRKIISGITGGADQ